MTKLELSEIQKRVGEIEGWEFNDEQKLQRNLTFKSFKEAFAFMTQVALYAEEKAHHPEWFNVYNKVEIQLTTHDAGGVSEKDFAFATYVNTLK